MESFNINLAIFPPFRGYCCLHDSQTKVRLDIKRELLQEGQHKTVRTESFIDNKDNGEDSFGIIGRYIGKISCEFL